MSWFKKIVDEFLSYDELMRDLNKDIPIESKCVHESANSDCSLIQKLKDLQAKKRDVDSKIKSYSDHSDVNLLTFIEFLSIMEGYGFEMRCEYRFYHNPGYYNSWIRRTFSDFYGVGRFEKVIDKMTDADIDKIYEELKSFKHRATILSELQQQSSALDAEIKSIKDTLGIE